MTEKNIESILKENGIFVSTTSGASMYPMLRDRRDTIVVAPISKRLKKYDVALYRRGDRYVLHRVIKVLPDSYVIRGDNCAQKEHIPDSDLLGCLVKFYRGDKEKSLDGTGYKLYSRLVVLLHPLVSLKLFIRPMLRRGGR